MSEKDAGAVLEIVEPHVELLTPSGEIKDYLRRLEWCGRVCYKSEEKITPESADEFIRKIRRSGHESVLEHCSITAKFIGSRTMSHQLVRHRIAAYSQESQRYCNYGNKDTLKVTLPPSIAGDSNERHGWVIFFDSSGNLRSLPTGDDARSERLEHGSPIWTWAMACIAGYRAYNDLLALGIRPEDAREVLPNSTKTEVVTTYNLRQWRHFFRMRCDKHAQWQIRKMATSLLQVFSAIIPAVFEDLAEEFLGGKNGSE